ncbi:MAG: two-component system sensor histidine kinase CreC [Methylophilus sp.]|nr:two-component system sensor histidine kinase CreC [Methylophilus sp.]MDP3609378.1 two-component system sensor histidine kinase CreC [Methylophilus sp.]
MKLPFNFNISLKIFLGYFALVGLAAWFVLTIFVNEVKPGVRQAMENSLVDTAHVLAELATEDVKRNQIQHGHFAKSIQHYLARISNANIWGIQKHSTDYRIYITNRYGIVIYDSANLALGQDYANWNDVYLTLRGKYGVRSSPAIAGDANQDTVMYVAAPIKDGNAIIGSLTVAKPNRTLLPFIERAQRKIIQWGALLFVLSIFIGGLFTWRFTTKIHKLRDYALRVSKGEKAMPPTSSNDELAELALAMQTMRNELDGKQYVQDSVQHLTHELKSPITAIQGAAELISPHMPEEAQTHFLTQIKTQSNRLQTIIQNMLGLATLEHQQQLHHLTQLNLKALVDTQIAHLSDKATQRSVQFKCIASTMITIKADAFLLGQAIYNVLENALDFSPSGSTINVYIRQTLEHAEICIEDQGTGIPDYALSKILNKFYSLPRPNTGQKSTGLGLNFVLEVMKLHHAEFSLQNRPDVGVTATFSLPLS